MEIFAPGTIIGDKYETGALLGIGGMGHVYAARHRQVPEFQVAIKVLDPELTSNVVNMDRFRNEVIAGYRVNHPNVVQMYEYFDLGALQAFAMEHVDGGSLFGLMHRGPIKVEIAVCIMKQIAMALSALHAVGTFHRDLKPENVLLKADRLVKLTDFGVARIRGGACLNEPGQLVGTPKYVAPEYLEDGESDHRGDIYSYGVLSYELLSNESPFHTLTRDSLLRERIEIRGHDLLVKKPDLPAPLGALVERCMAIDPLQRFPRADDVVEAIRSIQQQNGWKDYIECENTRPTTRVSWTEVLKSFSEEQASEVQS